MRHLSNRQRESRLVESLEPRTLFAVTVTFIAPSTLNFTGDFQADTIVINDNGAGVISGAANNATGTMIPFGSFAGITTVNVNAGANNDSVQYTVTGDMPSSVRYVNVILGEGDDRFDARMNADIDMGFPSYLAIRGYGESGNDMLTALSRGEMDGHLAAMFDGGTGNDRLYTDVRLDSGSGGGPFCRSHGGDGDDTIDLVVRKANPLDPAWIDAFASGGTGVDLLTKTANVVSDATIEVVVIVP
jgi:hypothetical protein